MKQYLVELVITQPLDTKTIFSFGSRGQTSTVEDKFFLFPPWLSAYRALEREMPSGIPLTNKTFSGKLQETNKITSQNEAQIIVEDSDDNLRRKYAM